MRTNKRSPSRTAGVALGVGLLVGMAHSPLWAGTRGSGAGPVSPPVIHVVAPGETLWAIAQRYAPRQDPRIYIYDLQQANNLGNGPLYPGESLALP